MPLHDRKLLVLWTMDPLFDWLSVARTTDHIRPGPVIYWMQASQRTIDNRALTWALMQAGAMRRPLRLIWIGMGNLPYALDSAFEFMRQGMAELVPVLAAWKLPLDVLLIPQGSASLPAMEVASYLDRVDACLLVCDQGPLRWQRQTKTDVCKALDAVGSGCSVHIVEANTLVAVETLAESALWSAASARPRIHRLYARVFAEPLYDAAKLAMELPKKIFTNENPGSSPDRSDPPSGWMATDGWMAPGVLLDRPAFFKTLGRHYTGNLPLNGGQGAAQQRLDTFFATGLEAYGAQRSDPLADAQSGLSPYLHFGQIGPGTIVRRIEDHLGQLCDLDASPRTPADPTQVAGGQSGGLQQKPLLLDRLLRADKEKSIPNLVQGSGFSLETLPQLEGIAAFFEELVVRRELAINWVWFNPKYDHYEGLPQWALRTLEAHKTDPRPYRYSLFDLEQAQTHDPYWNAAQRQMLETGIMHGYMRMYWGKKILEWSTDPQEGFYTAMQLNDRWMLDGRDANGYAGVAWCFGAHDRPWTERAIFGTVRYMNDKGLERKFNIKSWAQRWTVAERDGLLFS